MGSFCSHYAWLLVKPHGVLTGPERSHWPSLGRLMSRSQAAGPSLLVLKSRGNVIQTNAHRRPQKQTWRRSHTVTCLLQFERGATLTLSVTHFPQLFQISLSWGQLRTHENMYKKHLAFGGLTIEHLCHELSSSEIFYLLSAQTPNPILRGHSCLQIISEQAPGCASGPIKARLRCELTFVRGLGEGSGLESHQSTYTPILSITLGKSAS